MRPAVVICTLAHTNCRGNLDSVSSMSHPDVRQLHPAYEQYLENASKPLESQAFYVKAACMCADISGFTALSEKHCKKGTAGLDTLVQVILFQRLLSSLYFTLAAVEVLTTTYFEAHFIRWILAR